MLPALPVGGPALLPGEPALVVALVLVVDVQKAADQHDPTQHGEHDRGHAKGAHAGCPWIARRRLARVTMCGSEVAIRWLNVSLPAGLA